MTKKLISCYRSKPRFQFIWLTYSEYSVRFVSKIILNSILIWSKIWFDAIANSKFRYNLNQKFWPNMQFIYSSWFFCDNMNSFDMFTPSHKTRDMILSILVGNSRRGFSISIKADKMLDGENKMWKTKSFILGNLIKGYFLI